MIKILRPFLVVWVFLVSLKLIFSVSLGAGEYIALCVFGLIAALILTNALWELK